MQHEGVGGEVESFSPRQPNPSATVDGAMSLVGHRHGRTHVIDEAHRQKLFAVPFSFQAQKFAEARPIMRIGVEKAFSKERA